MSKYELDFEQVWTTKEGLLVVVLMTSMGHRCGYVSVEEGHPFHGVEYMTEAPNGERPDCAISVHGGITYSSYGHDLEYPLPTPGGWWFGFDCNHLMDREYPKSLGYCVTQCESMSEQLAAMT